MEGGIPVSPAEEQVVTATNINDFATMLYGSDAYLATRPPLRTLGDLAPRTVLRDLPSGTSYLKRRLCPLFV